MERAEEDDRPGPIFFLSYARATPPRDPLVGRVHVPPVVRLFSDLWFHVGELVGPPVGVDPGFLDQSMRGSQVWSDALMEAVGQCQVFVPLISQPYLRSAWCAREWHAFAERKVQPPGQSAAILPVIWLPTADADVPSVIRRLQFFSPPEFSDPNMSDRYYAEGVYGLITMGDESYGAIAWRLARQIVEIYRNQLVEPKVITDHRRLPLHFPDDES